MTKKKRSFSFYLTPRTSDTFFSFIKSDRSFVFWNFNMRSMTAVVTSGLRTRPAFLCPITKSSSKKQMVKLVDLETRNNICKGVQNMSLSWNRKIFWADHEENPRLKLSIQKNQMQCCLRFSTNFTTVHSGQMPSLVEWSLQQVRLRFLLQF